MLIYIVEDDTDIRELETYALKNSGYEVKSFGESKSFFKACAEIKPLLVILDVMLPDFDGLSVLEKLRKDKFTKNIPVILVTAKSSEMDKVKGLDMGADDYITKPFKLNELLSRIKAILRRSLQFSKADTFLEANGVRVDTAERLVWKNEKPLDLPLVEYKLLCLFMQNPNHLMPREMILDRMWDGNGNFVDDNTLSVYIRRLRNKIEDTPNQPKNLLTERGIGYKWVVE